MSYAIKVHFSKPGSKKGKPWTLHYNGRCTPASRITFAGVTAITVFKPQKKANPRAWLSLKGKVQMLGKGVAYITQERGRR